MIPGDLPLSKYLDPEHDLPRLAQELALVDQVFDAASPQHPMRRWEYAMALRAIKAWRVWSIGSVAADVGGAGSPFAKFVARAVDLPTTIIDPGEVDSETLASYLYKELRLFPIVTCLSVLEHVDNLPQFLYHLSCLTAPGGLLILTVDACGCEHPGDDPHHFHWMRRRVFTPKRLATLSVVLEDLHFSVYGSVDWAWHGAHVYDYSFASLVLVKRP